MIDIHLIERVTRNKFFVKFTRLGQVYRWWVEAEDTE